jgi:hypothetical protein
VVLDLIDCPDRRLAKAAAELVQAEAQLPGSASRPSAQRSYAPLLGRLLHDHTADRIASVVSQIPHAAATIVPFDVRRRVRAWRPASAHRRPQPNGRSRTGRREPGRGSATCDGTQGRSRQRPKVHGATQGRSWKPGWDR